MKVVWRVNSVYLQVPICRWWHWLLNYPRLFQLVLVLKSIFFNRHVNSNKSEVINYFYFKMSPYLVQIYIFTYNLLSILQEFETQYRPMSKPCKFKWLWNWIPFNLRRKLSTLNGCPSVTLTYPQAIRPPIGFHAHQAAITHFQPDELQFYTCGLIRTNGTKYSIKVEVY